MRDLPRDVLIHILIRLPAKSIGQFKSVCKYWFSLISSADFAKLHHHRAISNTNTDHSRVFIMSCNSSHSVNFALASCYEGFNDDDTSAIVTLNNPLEKTPLVDNYELMMGSCYGLIYFACYNDHILLWNPTTQEKRLIPHSSAIQKKSKKKIPHWSPSFLDRTRFYRLGYDLITDDYKMLRATHSISSKSISSEVFSLKTGSWRTVQDSHIDINRPDKIKIFSNGAVHWLVRTVCGSDKLDTILSFDMKEETFKETALPNITRSEYTGFVVLGDLKGCLYAVYGGDGGVDLDIWVMNEYGVENSWSMMIRLSCVEFGSDYSMWHVCFTHEDDVVISVEWDIVRYNLSDKTMKKFKRCLTDWTSPLVYTETLVSPYV